MALLHVIFYHYSLSTQLVADVTIFVLPFTHYVLCCRCGYRFTVSHLFFSLSQMQLILYYLWHLFILFLKWDPWRFLPSFLICIQVICSLSQVQLYFYPYSQHVTYCRCRYISIPICLICYFTQVLLYSYCQSLIRQLVADIVSICTTCGTCFWYYSGKLHYSSYFYFLSLLS